MSEQESSNSNNTGKGRENKGNLNKRVAYPERPYVNKVKTRIRCLYSFWFHSSPYSGEKYMKRLVSKVIDVDTFKTYRRVNGSQYIRLAGVNAPEKEKELVNKGFPASSLKGIREDCYMTNEKPQEFYLSCLNVALKLYEEEE